MNKDNENNCIRSARGRVNRNWKDGYVELNTSRYHFKEARVNAFKGTREHSEA